jgi:ribonuclease J
MTEQKTVTRNSLKVSALGGLHELGKNMWLFEAGGENPEYLIVDAGIMFPGHDSPGVDYILADYKAVADKQLQALVLTSVHESHSGGAHHLINRCAIKKVIGSSLALEATKLKLEAGKVQEIEWIPFESRQSIKLSKFNIVPFTISSSSSDTYALVVESSGARVFYTGTYKIEQTPTDGHKTDIAAIVSYCEVDPIDIYIGDSAGVEADGYSGSEMDLLKAFRDILKSSQGRVFINTYNSNTIRIQNIFKAAEEAKRKVALLNKNIRDVYQAMCNAGILEHENETLISIHEINNYPDNQILVLCSAPEGAAISELELIAYDKSLEVQLKEGDTVVNSADLPPGTVRVMAQISDQFFLKDVKIIGGRASKVHVESHALMEEMKFMFNLIRPRSMIPAFGETRHLVRHAKVAVEAGFDPAAIFILDNGDVAEIVSNPKTQSNDIQILQKLESGDILFNHAQDFHMDDKIIKEREAAALDGVVMVSFTVNKKRQVISGPVFTAKACTFSNNKEWRAFCLLSSPNVIETIDDLTHSNPNASIDDYQSAVREYMNKIIRQQIGKKPAIMVFANEV